MIKKFIIAFSVILFFLAGIRVSFSGETADVLSYQATQLMQAGKFADALEMMKEAVNLEPKDPVLHSNYAGLLFKKGQITFREGQKGEAKVIFKEAESELLSAINLSSDAEQDKMRKARCYYLLGDIYLVSFENKEKAKFFYQEVLKYDPQHREAQKVLKKLN